MLSLNLIISIYLLSVILTHYCFVLQMRYFPNKSKHMIRVRDTKPWVLFIPAFLFSPFFLIGYFVVFCCVSYLVIITGESYKNILEMYKKLDKKDENNP